MWPTRLVYLVYMVAVVLIAVDHLLWYMVAIVAVVPVVPLIAAALDGMELYGAAFVSSLIASIVGLVWAGGSTARRGPGATLARGLGAFGAGLVVCGAAGSMPVFLLGRVLEGFGGGVSTTVLYAAVTRAWPASERSRTSAGSPTAASWLCAC